MIIYTTYIHSFIPVVCTCCGVVCTCCGVVCTCCGVDVVCTCCACVRVVVWCVRVVVWTWCVRVVRDVVTWMCRRNERFDFVVSVVSCSLSSWNGWNGWMDGWMHTGRVVGRMEGALRRGVFLRRGGYSWIPVFLCVDKSCTERPAYLV